MFQVEVFWVMMMCGVLGGYQLFISPCCLKMQAAWTYERCYPTTTQKTQHNTVSQPTRPRLDI